MPRVRIKVTRREVLAAISGATAALATAVPLSAWRGDAARLGANSPVRDSSPPSTIAHSYVFFDAAEARFIEAACQRLIPAGSVGNGALGADVPQYLDAQLAGAWGAGTRPYRDGPWQPGTPSDARSLMFEPAALFRSAIRALTRDSRVPFEQLPADAQDDYLRSLESGRRELEGVPSAAFFAMLLAMTVEGFLSHPLHGSTRDKVAWRVQGFAGAHAAVPSRSASSGLPREEAAGDVS
ncbi:MAG: gluconate 2-dehydrogenase subunit 3 family protein [Pseudomonadota bacterium]|nr:gluconate 2-dehydrogenase subunit 3 family protein [Pseudomonadota bacterium]